MSDASPAKHTTWIAVDASNKCSAYRKHSENAFIKNDTWFLTMFYSLLLSDAFSFAKPFKIMVYNLLRIGFEATARSSLLMFRLDSS